MNTTQFYCMVLVLLTSVLTACEKPLENPEAFDPIYADLKAEMSSSEHAATDEEKAVEEAVKEIEKLEPGSRLRPHAMDDRYGHEKQLTKQKQRAQFYKIRADKRLSYIKEQYPRYFQQKKPWPDKSEYQAYLAAKRMENAPRDWNSRVPKYAPAPGGANPKKIEKSEKEAEGQGKKAHGE